MISSFKFNTKTKIQQRKNWKNAMLLSLSLPPSYHRNRVKFVLISVNILGEYHLLFPIDFTFFNFIFPRSFFIFFFLVREIKWVDCFPFHLFSFGTKIKKRWTIKNNQRYNQEACAMDTKQRDIEKNIISCINM